MKILVTGGAGFIGSHLVNALLDKGHTVRIVDNLSTGLQKNVNPDAKFYKTDIRRKKINTIFKTEKPDIVYHLAGQINLRKSLKDPVFDADVNVLGSLNILKNCKKYKVKKVIFSSTGGAIYSASNTIPTPETSPAQPLSPYGLNKLAIEQYLKIFDLNYISLRYANVYGPRQNTQAEAGVIAIFIQNILDNKPCVINGDGAQTRDYVYVDDVVKANLLALEKNVTGIYNVGTGIETSVNEIFNKIVDGMTKGDIAKQLGPAIKGELQHSALDYEKIKKELGWKPEINLNKGLALTIDWFKNNR